MGLMRNIEEKGMQQRHYAQLLHGFSPIPKLSM